MLEIETSIRASRVFTGIITHKGMSPPNYCSSCQASISHRANMCRSCNGREHVKPAKAKIEWDTEDLTLLAAEYGIDNLAIGLHVSVTAIRKRLKAPYTPKGRENLESWLNFR